MEKSMPHRGVWRGVEQGEERERKEGGMERRRRERGVHWGRQGLLEGVVGRRVGWQHLQSSSAPGVWDLPPAWRTEGRARLVPATRHGARVPRLRAPTRLAPSHTEHSAVPMETPNCWFPWKHLPVPHRDPQSDVGDETLKVHKAFG